MKRITLLAVAILTLAACDIDGDGRISTGESAATAAGAAVGAVYACDKRRLNC